jgi:hypothetical protein
MCWNLETSNRDWPLYDRVSDGYFAVKTPPLLLGVTLLFWGWQTGFLAIGAVMGVVLESSRLIKARWEFSDEDFRRIWAFCSVLVLAALVYGFNSNEGPSQFSRLFQDPTVTNQSGAGTAGARTAITLFRWMPMTLFLVVAAQAYSSREEIPWTAISLILRWRWKRAQKSGRPWVPAPRGLNIGFPYFGICLFAASSHAGENSRYFWGLCLLLAWALWSQRSRRFGIAIWVATFGLAIVLGYAGQQRVGRLQNYVTRLNVEWLSRFFLRGTNPGQSITSLGRIGRLKVSGRIVIRLKPEIGAPPAYLREASYCSFGSPVWSVRALNTDFREVALDTNGTRVVLLPGKATAARVQIACYLRGRSLENGERSDLLPLPTGSGRLDNLPAFAFTIKTNTAGAVLAEGPGLAIFDACYGPGATIDSLPGTNDLNVPQLEEPALDQVISGLRIKETNTAEVLQTLNGFFQSKFSYSIWQEPPKPASEGETPLSRFLLQTHSGHCEYFATATVLLLRKFHIPARYAVGYAVHEPSGKGYVVRERDGHAWCLVWDKQSRTWQDFDTTPASWVSEESKRASPMQWLSDLGSWIGFQFSKFRWGQTHLRRYLLFTLVPVLALLLYQIVFRRNRKRRLHSKPGTEADTAWPGLDSEFYLVERRVAERGVLRRPDEPLSGWLERARLDPALAEVNDPLQALLRLHYRYRFDPRSLDSAGREELRRGTQAVLQALS